MAVPLRVLLLEDSEADAELLLRVLRRGGCDPEVERVDTAAAMTAALDEHAWDVVIADHTMPSFSAVAGLELLKARELDLPFIIVSGTIGEQAAVEAMRAGAHDYVMKDDLTRLVPAIERELRESAIRTERRRFEAQLQYLADHDTLTGLFNRRRYEEELSRQVAYAARYGEGGAVLVLDLDNFKYVNDSLGHRAGDELIRSVANVVRRRLRDTDVLARLGGDEFAVLLLRVGADQALSVAEDLLEAVRDHLVVIGGQRLRVTTSIGLAGFDEEVVPGEELLANADLAMYEAKEAGRDRLAVYTPARGEQARMEARHTWNERIRKALDEDLFELYCQPILDLRSRDVRQYELLLRMVGDGGEIVPPSAFLPSAERFGLIEAVDRWVVRRAIQLMAEHRRAGRELRLEVNLSGRSIENLELTALIEREIEGASIDPANLIFEVRETAAIATMDEAKKFADKLCSLGCGFALDDFGSGFSSFYYVKYLPLDYLKIDGDFIRSVRRGVTDQLVVKAIVTVASGLGMKTIAEFVGDRETAQLLQEYGVDYAQGYYIGRPRPVSEIGAGAGDGDGQRRPPRAVRRWASRRHA